jgi:bifunctional oligoribonuclease and PAP phosphatase NrnA
MMIWNELSNLIDANQTFVISSHVSLDGDSIGSQLAFYWYLTSKGKTVQIFTHDPVPAKFGFLQNAGMIRQEKPACGFDVLIVLDCSNPHRLGWDEYKDCAKFIVDIDHHRDNTRFGNINIVDTKAAATGEIIYHFFTDCNIDYPAFVAESLYMAIMSDTGGFRFSNTGSSVLKACADLSDRGAQCSPIYDRVYSSRSRNALMLQSKIWSSLKYYCNDSVSVMQMPLSILDELGAQYSDSEGMADHTITAEGIKVGIMAKHSPQETHFSLRSRGAVDVGKIAQQIPGGGGHSGAAGCTVALPYDQALTHILSIIEKELG